MKQLLFVALILASIALRAQTTMQTRDINVYSIANDCDPKLEGSFKGRDDEVVCKLNNGPIEAKHLPYHYNYAYHSDVVICRSASGNCHIEVDRDNTKGFRRARSLTGGSLA